MGRHHRSGRGQANLSGILALERLDAGTEFGVGTRWNETRKLFGRESTEELEVTAIDPGKSYTVENESGGVRYTTVFVVSPRGDGSVVSMSMESEAVTTSGKLMAVVTRLVSGSIRKMLATDLDDIAAAAEATDGEAGSPTTAE